MMYDLDIRIDKGNQIEEEEEETGNNTSRNSNEFSILTDKDLFETSEQQVSQDLFSDDDNSTHNSPIANNFTTLSEITKDLRSPSDLFVTPIQLSKILRRERSPTNAIIPTVPSSLIPFISTVNESWTSDLETPNAETAASNRSVNSENVETKEQLKSCESAQRNRCDSIRSEALLPDATTPRCFISREEEEGFSLSPVLQTGRKRRRPKRRILKSLDNTISTSCLMDLTNVVQSLVDECGSKLEKNIVSEAENGNRIHDFADDQSAAINNIDRPISMVENSLICNSKRQVASVGTNFVSKELGSRSTKDPSVLGNILNLEPSIANERKDRTEMVPASVSDDKTDISLNNLNKKSVKDRLKEIKELRKRIPQFRESNFADIPNEVFTREIEALKNAEMCEILSNVGKRKKTNVKNEWGLISFTQMCLLEKESSGNELRSKDLDNLSNDPNVGVAQVGNMDETMVEKNDVYENVERNKSAAMSLEEEEEERVIKDIFASSFLDKEEAVIDVEELSPWFYQSDDKKVKNSKNPVHLSLERNVEQAINRSETTILKGKCGTFAKEDELTDFSSSLTQIKEGRVENDRRIHSETSLAGASSVNHQWKDKISERIIPGITSYSSVGFSTASGKPIKVSEDKIRKAMKLYNELAVQDGGNCDVKSLNEIVATSEDHQRNKNKSQNVNRLPVITENIENRIGFSTASGKPIKVSEDKLKKATKLYNELSRRDGKDEFELLNKITPREDQRVNKNENENISRAVIEKNCQGTIGFSTASGKPIKVSEDKLKKATKLYNELARQDGKDCQFEMLDAINTPKDHQVLKNENEDICRTVIPGNVYSMPGFSTAGGKAIKISEEKIKQAENLFAKVSAEVGDDVSENFQPLSHLPGVFTTRGIKRKLEPNQTSDFNSAIGFTSAHGQPRMVNGTAMKKAKLMYDSEDINLEDEIERSKNISMPKNEPKVIRLSPQPKPAITKPRNVLTGFSTAGGKSLSVNKSVLKRAEQIYKNLSDAVDCEESAAGLGNIDTDLGNRTSDTTKRPPARRDEGSKTFAGNMNSGFSKAEKYGGEGCSEFERGNKLLATEQKNTPPCNFLTKRSILQAIETSANSNVSVFKTPGFCSPFKTGDPGAEDDAECDFQRSKKVRLSYDLQRRKLFSGKGSGDTDDEAENLFKFDKEKNETRRASFNGSKDRTRYFPSNERRESLSSVHNNGPGIYANSEMFQTTDRVVIPKLEPQKSSPHFDLRLTEVRDEGLTAIFEEVTASTEALLADEENSNDSKSWASAITCSPNLIEEREIQVRSITLGENGDIVQEAPTSPIIGDKFRFKKKKRRSRKSLMAKKALDVITKTNDRFNGNEIFDEPIDTFCSQQLDATRSISGSSKESNKNAGPVVDIAIISKSSDLGETSMDAGVLKSEYQEPISSEIYNKEVLADALENRIAATLEQEKIVRGKKKLKPKPTAGSLFISKTGRKESRLSLRDLTNGIPPVARTSEELIDLGIGLDVTEITASNAARYRLKCLDFGSGEKIRADAFQLDVGDGGRLILDENGFAGAEEFERAFIASPGVDPTLVPQGWVENHYRWILWKLASMDRKKVGKNRMVTADHIMKQLKYRYDREIDRSQRPALRKIVEKDDPASRRMVLCVANLTKISSNQYPDLKSPLISTPTAHWNVELTDGWYGIAASIDAAMAHFISSGKVREGTKLVVCGAELLNCDQGCSPLEIPSEVSLKIHCNSTRRARWDSRLGYCRNSGPIPSKISTVIPDGGLIGKLETIIARVYPIQYFEKNPSGQAIFRNEKCEDKAAMIYENKRQAQIDAIYDKARADFELKRWKDLENSAFGSSIEVFKNEIESELKNSLPPPRNVTPVIKARVIEGTNIATITVWAPSEEILNVFKEGNRVSVHNLLTSERRSGELHLTVGRQSFVNHVGSAPDFPRRCLTPIAEVNVPGFNPMFGDFDTVGVVVSLGPAPHGMKNFEVVNLASPDLDSSSSSAYLSILFWEGIAAYGYSEILTIGSTVACSNLQWRKGLPRNIPIAYSTEHSIFTRNPRQVHLRSTFDRLNYQITDLSSYVTQCATEIAEENEKKSIAVRSPAFQESPSKTTSPFSVSVNQRTPQDFPVITTPAKYSIQRRLEKLQWYGDPPDLSPITLNYNSVKVKQKFIPLVRTPEQQN